MDKTLVFKSQFPRTIVKLPFSKSLSNRALIINALADGNIPLYDLAECDDTHAMQNALAGDTRRVNVGHAGTAARFLTAYFSLLPGEHFLTGSTRLCQRPIAPLVDALRQLGADITYTDEEGHLPILIRGRELHGAPLTLKGSISSQFISALFMIAPYVRDGFTITITPPILSLPYIQMTLQIMRHFGYTPLHSGKTYQFHPGQYTPKSFYIEKDWTAASYFYELLAIAGQGEIFLPGLQLVSMQGDTEQIHLWKEIGVQTQESQNGILIQATAPTTNRLHTSLRDMPDIALSLAVACCMRRIPFHFTGLHTLTKKECNRITTFAREILKLGYRATVDSQAALSWGGYLTTPSLLPINPRDDHRVAMSFAMAAIRHPNITIRNAEVVTKSFPSFWQKLSPFLLS